MEEIIIKKDKNGNKIFSLVTSYVSLNYNEEGKMYLSFHDTKSVSTMLSEKELDILINELTKAKNILKERNEEKGEVAKCK